MKNLNSILIATAMLSSLATPSTPIYAEPQSVQLVNGNRGMKARYRTYGPGTNQRKRRKIARHSPNSRKWGHKANSRR